MRGCGGVACLTSEGLVLSISLLSLSLLPSLPATKPARVYTLALCLRSSPVPPSHLLSFSKDESLTTNATQTHPGAFAGFDFLVTESPSFHSQLFEVVFEAPGFKAVEWKRARVVTVPALFVMHARAGAGVAGSSSAVPPAAPPPVQA